MRADAETSEVQYRLLPYLVRALALLTVYALVFAVLAGCRSTPEPTSTFRMAATPPVTVASPLSNEPMPLRVVESADGSASVLFSEGLAAGMLELEIGEIADPTSVQIPPGYAEPLHALVLSALPVESDPIGPLVVDTLTLSIRLDGLFQSLSDVPDRLAVINYDQSKVAWTEIASEIDFPWLRVQASTESLGMFVVTVATAADGSNEGSSTEPTPTTSAETASGIDQGRGSVGSNEGTPDGDTEVSTPVPGQPPTVGTSPSSNEAGLILPTPSPVALATRLLSITPTPRATATPTLAPTGTPTPTPTITPTPSPRYLLYINGRQVLPQDAVFYVPLGILSVKDLPGPDGRYPFGAQVSFEIQPTDSDSEIEVAGADRIEGETVRVAMNAHRFVTVYISLPPRRAATAAPTEFPTISPAPSPTPTPSRSPTISPTASPTPTPTRTPTPTAIVQSQPSSTNTPTPTPTREMQPAPQPEPTPEPVPVYPVGGRIAFQTERDGNGEIYMVGCDGSNLLNLSDNEAEDRHPSWSGNGLIAFASNRDSPPGGEGNFDIYLLNVETKGVTRLTENPANDHSPALSLLGDKVAFVSDRSGNSEIHVLEIAGENLSNVSNNQAEVRWTRKTGQLVKWESCS